MMHILIRGIGALFFFFSSLFVTILLVKISRIRVFLVPFPAMQIINRDRWTNQRRRVAKMCREGGGGIRVVWRHGLGAATGAETALLGT